MKYKLHLFIALSLLASFNIFAQEKKEPVALKMNGLGFVPLYTINNGIRIDFDRRISTISNQWIIVSPQVYIKTGENIFLSFDDSKMQKPINSKGNSSFGLGVDIKHRVFVSKHQNIPKGLYIEYGPMYQHYKIKDDQSFSKPYTENGSTYYSVASEKRNITINKFGGNIHVGYQFFLRNVFYIDFYGGAGVRFSFDNINDGFTSLYNTFWPNQGYTGTLLDLGVRFGFCF